MLSAVGAALPLRDISRRCRYVADGRLSHDNRRELPAIRHAEFGHDLGDVVFDRAHPNPQHVADLLIGQALRHEVPHFFLAWRQAAHRLTPAPRG